MASVGGAANGAATGAAIGSTVPGIGTGIGAAVGGLAGFFGGGHGEKRARELRNQAVQAGLKELNPLAIGQTFQGLSDIQSPFFNQLLADASLSGQSQARGLQGGLNRAGLGNTGIGAVLGQGAMQGANFQAQTLRSRMLQDLLQQATGIRGQRASIITGTPTQFTSNPDPSAMQRIGAGLQAGALFGQQFNGGASNTGDANSQVLNNLSNFNFASVL